MEHALVRGDARMLDDPLRAQSLSVIVGSVLAVIAVAVCAVLAFVRPQGSLEGARIVVVKDSGAPYVLVGDTWHPALNMASARLVAGGADAVRTVSRTTIARAKRGPAVGIPGAPTAVDPPLAAAESAWTVCDDGASQTSVLVGDRPVGAETLDDGHGVLVTPRSQGPAVTYLIHDGRRARVDLRDPAVVRGLRLEGVVPRTVSDALIAVWPESPPITPPRIAAAGTPALPAGYTVGTVVALQGPAGRQYFVLLADGVQQIGEVTAELIRFTVTQQHRGIPTVEPTLIARLPVVDTLPVSAYPRTLSAVQPRVLCGRWSADGGGAGTAVLVGDGMPAGHDDPLVTLARADADGPAADAFGMPAGRSAFVRSVGITGRGAPGGSLFLLDDLGVLFGVRDRNAADRLGLTAAVPAPWPVLALLPRGPELSAEAASVVSDRGAPS